MVQMLWATGSVIESRATACGTAVDFDISTAGFIMIN